MRVLLIRPPLEFPSPDKRPQSHPEISINPPLGLAFLAAYLEKFGHEVEILDAPIIKKPIVKDDLLHYGPEDEFFIRYVENFNPQIIGISVPSTFQAKSSHSLASLIKKEFRDFTNIRFIYYIEYNSMFFIR